MGHRICGNSVGASRPFVSLFKFTPSHLPVQHFRSALELTAAAGTEGCGAGSFARTPTVASRVEAALHEGFRDTDSALIRSCAAAGPAMDYAAATAAVALITGDLLTVGHLGDSKVVLGRVGSSGLVPSASGSSCTGVYLTTDHKPDQPAEHRRIVASGGSLEFLSGGRPFIRCVCVQRTVHLIAPPVTYPPYLPAAAETSPPGRQQAGAPCS